MAGHTFSLLALDMPVLTSNIEMTMRFTLPRPASGLFLCLDSGSPRLMPVRYPRHADDLSICLDHSICDKPHIGRPEDYPVPPREEIVTSEGGVQLPKINGGVPNG